MDGIDFSQFESYLVDLARGELVPVLRFILNGLFLVFSIAFAGLALRRAARAAAMSGSMNVKEQHRMRASVLAGFLLAGAFGAAPFLLSSLTATIGIRENDVLSYSQNGLAGAGISSAADALYTLAALIGWFSIIRGLFLADRAARSDGNAAEGGYGAVLVHIITGVILANLEGSVEVIFGTLNL